MSTKEESKISNSDFILREKIRKAKAQQGLKLERNAKDNKKGL